MSRESRPYRDVCRLSVPYLPDHYYVWVLPEKRAEPAGKCVTCDGIDLRLSYELQPVLDRVFYRHDIEIVG